MASETSKKILKEVRPILSLHHSEAKRRVISLYKSWYRQIPHILKNYEIVYSEKQCKDKLREEFTKHPTIKDVRVIDMMIIKGRMDLEEIVEKWTPKQGVVRYFNGPKKKTSDSFLAKFLTSKDC